jgi:hypothetical protein
MFRASRLLQGNNGTKLGKGRSEVVRVEADVTSSSLLADGDWV